MVVVGNGSSVNGPQMGKSNCSGGTRLSWLSRRVEFRVLAFRVLLAFFQFITVAENVRRRTLCITQASPSLLIHRIGSNPQSISFETSEYMVVMAFESSTISIRRDNASAAFEDSQTAAEYVNLTSSALRRTALTQIEKLHQFPTSAGSGCKGSTTIRM